MPGQTSGSDAGPVSDSASVWSRGPIHLAFIDRVLLHWRPNHWCIMGWLIGGGGNTADELMKLPWENEGARTKPHPIMMTLVLCLTHHSSTVCILFWLSRWILITLQENRQELSVACACQICLLCYIYRLVEVPVGGPVFDSTGPLSAQLTRCRLTATTPTH